MEIRVSPTRMQLLRLKKRLSVAKRGHKLLKDKLDELMKHFLELVKESKDLRDEVEKKLFRAFSGFTYARAVMSANVLEEAIMAPKERISLFATQKNIMSVKVPEFSWHKEGNDEKGDIYPYGFAFTSMELDSAIDLLSEAMPSLMELAHIEKSAELLADEIEKTRRRVNALEYVMIPGLEDTIGYITMKLEEAERGNLTRLMKVKDIVRNRAVGGREY
jgi:V/A-type H+-transporting ATPase subunit D